VALGRALLKAVEFIRNTKRSERCNGRIHLVAHSMGNWALQGAIQSMRGFVGDNIPPLFDEVVLVAADEDADTLGDPKRLAPLTRGCQRVTVYYNHQDLALKASDVVIGNPDRLGRSGPAQRESLPEKIAAVNVSRVIIREAPPAERWTADETGHQYYRNNARIRQDLLAVLAGTSDADVVGRERYEGTWLLG
jgi:esterase/lipase superfamily enzyme